MNRSRRAVGHGGSNAGHGDRDPAQRPAVAACYHAPIVQRSSSRPLGQVTRGKTAPNRLRKTDVFLALAFPEFTRHLPGIYIDLGYGAYPITSVETLTRLRRLNPDVRVIGVEIDPERVAAAEPSRQPGLGFRLGGFNLPLAAGETAAVVRAFNVLRQYSEAEVAAALEALAVGMCPGALLIEGTSNPTGQLMTFNLYQRSAGRLETLGLVLAPGLRRAFTPRDLQPVLPKIYIHHAAPDGAIDRFFGTWTRAWSAARAHGNDLRQVFSASANRLRDAGYALDPRPALLRRGFLWLKPPWPTPQPPP